MVNVEVFDKVLECKRSYLAAIELFGKLQEPVGLVPI